MQSLHICGADTLEVARGTPANEGRKSYAIIFAMNTLYDTFPIQIESHIAVVVSTQPQFPTE